MNANCTESLRRSLKFALCAAIVGTSAFLSARPCSAQISFGKMREAAGKSEPAPAVVDEEDADSSAKADAKSDAAPNSTSSRRAPMVNRRSSGSRGAAARPAQPQALDQAAAATNGIANAQTNLEQESNEQKTPNASVSKPAPTSKTAPGAKPAPTSKTPGKSIAPTSKTNAPSNDDATVTNGKRGPVLGKPASHKYRAGMLFGAHVDGPCTNVIGTAPVPMEFPEQKVRTLEEEFPKVAKVDYRDLKEGGARQLVFKMRELKGGQTVQATALYEVTRYPMLPPTDPQIYEIPKKLPRDVQRYLKASQFMESTTKTIRSLAKDATEDKEGAWDKVAAILAYVRENIQYKEVMIEKPMRGAMAAIKTGDGDCEDMSALFISMCRAIDVPARLVRVPGHCWAEFYLVDDAKEGYWFPAQVAGTEELGSLQDTRVILQKGDSFRLPETPKEESLYVKELFMGSVKENAPDPVHQFVQEMDPKD